MTDHGDLDDWNADRKTAEVEPEDQPDVGDPDGTDGVGPESEDE